MFSNQVEEQPEGLQPGDLVEVYDAGGQFVGRGHGHPHTLIAARILTRHSEEALDATWLGDRLQEALDRRLRVCPERSAFRWVHGDGDGLSGLILDRFPSPEGELRVVASANSAGMDRWRNVLAELLRERFGVAVGVWKCTGRGRKLEGLPDEVALAWGTGPAAQAGQAWTLEDDGVLVSFDPWGGQKTGYFLDMWENRRRMAPALGQGRVADLFSYVGGWGLMAAKAGAHDVTCVDRSAAAVALVERNAKDNGLAERLRGECSSVEDFLGRTPDRSLDAVVCDPPAFVQSKKAMSAGLKAYRAVFSRALRKVRPGGYAVLASCSQRLDDAHFQRVIGEAARWAERSLRVLVRGDQSPCHPVPVAVPEARYLSCQLVQVDPR